MIPTLRRWLHRRQYPQCYAQLDRLLANQALDRAALLVKQQDDFAALVRHAATRVPYYTRSLGDLNTWDGRPESLPILTKEDVRLHLDDLLDRNADRARVGLGHTGGSTGQPLAFWYDEAKHELMRAGMMRGFMMSGWRPGQKVLYLWGARQDVGKDGVFGQRLADALAGEHTVAALEYSEERLAAWAARIRRWRPTLLYGYASALTELAGYVVDRNLAMPDSLIGVYSTAEMLLDESRNLMTRAFACQVFNQYGCREVPNIAWECRHGGMHVMADLVHLESVNVDGEDRLLVTSLSNRLMPFIRYELGDAGRLLEGECPCGSPFPLMAMGLCRKNDLIRAPGGKRVHPAVFNRLLYGLTQIRQYQWRQVAADRMALDLVCPAPLDANHLARLEAGLRAEVDPAMRLEVNYRAEIPRTASGKQRYIIGLE
ncbi:MAG: phenylacetate-CoA ligase [bacterium]|nr:MAG: phenylacetate-CoA ligase [bacterium]KAF0150677.1 MAG: phenylacetate-CoA ligase [bacterium]KAF0169530.1 MAG: phenylacetate-CoA ligase [bacterium]TXT22457.1 MAG: phenylacetate-CoA ligase [bacterium]